MPTNRDGAEAPADPRAYPTRPFLAVSAGIVRGGQLLLVRRAMPPAGGLWTFPGGVVEAGETLDAAVVREVEEETGLSIAPVGLAGYREFVAREESGRVARHFVILPFAARWLSGEPVLNGELSDARWVAPDEVGRFATTDGLPEIVGSVMRLLAAVPAEGQ